MEPEDEEEETEDDEEEDVPGPGNDSLIPLNDTFEYAAMRKQRHSSPGAYPVEEYEEEEEASEEDDDVDQEHILPEELTNHNKMLSEKLASLASPLPKSPRTPTTPRRSRPSSVARPASTRSWTKTLGYVAGSLAALFGTTSLWTYKRDLAWIGYCDADSNTNLRIRQLKVSRQEARDAAAVCYNSFNISEPFKHDLCLPLPFQTPMEAHECTPCPERAVCTPDSVTCQANFIIKPHFLSWLSPYLSGIPKVGAVAFPPTCVEDMDKLKKIGGLVTGLENWLAQTRGRKICDNAKIPNGDGGEAKALGLEFESLREAAKMNSRVGD